jgi:hypothetical protein
VVDLEAKFIFHLGSQSKTMFVGKPFSSWEDFFLKNLQHYERRRRVCMFEVML